MLVKNSTNSWGCCKKHDLKAQQLLNLKKHKMTDFISHSRIFLRTLTALPSWRTFMMILLQTDSFLAVHFGLLYAVYWCCTQNTTAESPVLLWFSLLAEISETHSYFSVSQRLLPPGSNGLHGNGFLFRCGYFHMTFSASL